MNGVLLLADFSLSNWTVGMSGAAALSVVALIGYLFGRSQRREGAAGGEESRSELQRAMRIARQLETIADDLRQDLARHSSQVNRFKSELRVADANESDEAWRRLRQEADNMVGPTLQLVSQLSTAYDKIRQQSQSLANFTGGRTDPLTGLANGRSLEEHLEVLLRARSEGGGESSVVVVSIDNEASDRETLDRQTQDDRVRDIGRHLARGLRGDDFAARYGVDEFVVVLPATTLGGASVFGTRLRNNLREQLGISISCGIAESMPADTPKSLLARADSAAYSARAAGAGQQYRHTGAAIRPDLSESQSPSGEEVRGTSEPAAVATVEPADEPKGDPENGSEQKPQPSDTPVTLALAGPAVSGTLLPGMSD